MQVSHAQSRYRRILDTKGVRLLPDMPLIPMIFLAVLLSGATFRCEAREDDDRAYAEMVRSLPQAKRQGRVDSVFLRFLDSLGKSSPMKDRSSSSLVKRWVEDAAKETHEETRLWYSLGMNEVRGAGVGGVSLSHYKIRPGEDVEIAWHDPEGKSPPPQGALVELALRDPSGPGAAVRYRSLDTSALRKDSVPSPWRRKLDKPGVYRVTLLSKVYFQQAYVQVGDLEILIKEDGDRYLVWGASSGNRLLPPYRVRATGPGDWSLDTATDERGLALLKVPKDPSFRKAVRVVLDKDGHAAFSGGVPNEAVPGKPIIWLFTDRPRYRPGNRLHIRGVVKTSVGDRGLEDRGKAPMRIKVRDHGGSLVLSREAAVDSWGNFGDSLDMPEEAGVGNWSVVAERRDTGQGGQGQEGFGWAGFEVEEYRKPDFRLEADSRWIGTRGKVSLRVKALYPDGTPVGGIPVEVKWFHGHPTWDPDPDYGVVWRHRSGHGYPRGVLRLDTLRLDAQGRGGLTLLPPPLAGNGWRLELTARDRAGRAVREGTHVRKTTNDLGILIQADRSQYHAGDLGRFWIIAREGDGRPRQGRVWVEFKVDRKPAFDTVLTLDAQGRAHFVTPLEETGHWSALADLDPERPDAAVSEVSFLVKRMDVSVRELPIRIDLIPQGEGRQDSVRFLLQGRWGAMPILATLEGPSLAAWKVIPPGNGSRLFASLALPRNAAHRARIMAAFPGPHGWEADSLILDLADTAHFLRASLEAANDWKPGERFQGRIRVTDARGRPAKVRFSVGVTDEAVYQGTGRVQDSAAVLIPARVGNLVRSQFGERSDEHLWATAGALRHPQWPRKANTDFDRGWDPYDSERYRAYHRQPRERKGGASIIFGRALPEWSSLDHANAVYILDATGSRADGEGRGEREASLRMDFRDHAWWAPMLTTDADGRAEVDFPWPDDIALWRLTARGAGPGAALLDFRDSLVTRLDLSIRLAAPRTFSVGDSALVTAIVSNATGKPLAAEISFASGDSAIALPVGSGSKAVNLVPGATPVRFPVRLLKAGRAEFRVAVRADGSGDGEIRSFPVIETGRREVTFRSGQVGRDSVPFHLDTGYRLASAKLEVALFSVPALALVGPVEKLLEYPYGCVEQTLSRFVPMLQVLGVLRGLGIRRDSLERRMQGIADSGLTRLESLMLGDEGWGWWKSGPFDPHLTALVVAGLHRAAQADLPPELRRRAVHLRDRGLKPFRKGLHVATLDPATAAGVAQAMALTLPIEAWQGLFERAWTGRTGFSPGSLAHVMTLARKAGDGGREREALALLLERIRFVEPRHAIVYPYYPEMQIWDLAEALIALVDAGKEPEMAARIAAWLHRIRQGEGWGSTRNTARVLEALARLAERQQGPVDGRIHLAINGRRLRSGAVSPGSGGAAYLQWDLAGPGVDSALRRGDNSLEFLHEGKGTLYFSARIIRNTVTPASAPAADTGGSIALKRSYRKAWYEPGPKGTWVRKTGPAGGRSFRPGEEVEVILDVESRHEGRYLLLEDPIPGGMEYQRPGQGEHDGYRLSLGDRIAHLEPRDDRVAIFSTWIPKGRTRFGYSLRAETRGRFHARPARVELMYRPEINAESPAATLSIRP